MSAASANDDSRINLSQEQRMLLRMRDTLYEGSWDDFVRDLQARGEGRPHVFDTVSTSPEMRKTIETHLVLIERMRSWEIEHASTLDPEQPE